MCMMHHNDLKTVITGRNEAEWVTQGYTKLPYNLSNCNKNEFNMAI